MPWPQTGATLYHAQLELQDKGRVIKGLVVYYNWDLKHLDLVKQSGPRLLLTVPWGINRMDILTFVDFKIYGLIKWYFIVLGINVLINHGARKII